MKIVADHFGPQTIQQSIAEYTSGPLLNDKTPRTAMGIYWSIFWKVNGDLRYDDTHPRYQVFPRLVPHDPTFDINEYKDVHIETAIKKIVKELGI